MNATINRLRHATHFMPAQEAQAEEVAPVIAAGWGNGGRGGQGCGGHGGRGQGRGGIPASRGVGPVQTNWVFRQDATLSPVPKSVHDMWQECMFGIGGRLPAKELNPGERG
jgi:hypothetical protein